MEAIESVLVEKEKFERMNKKIKDLEQALSEKKESVQEKEFPPTPPPLENQDTDVGPGENSSKPHPSQPDTMSHPKVVKKKKKKVKTRSPELTIPDSPRQQRRLTMKEIKKKLGPPGLNVGRARTSLPSDRVRNLAKSWITL